MTTRPTLSSYPEDAELWKWTQDVEGFVEDLIGSNTLPSAPAEVKVVAQSNSVKVTFRAVNEVGVSEYNIYRGTDKNFTGVNSELIATVTQAIDPSGTNIVYTDVEAVEKSYYFVSAVKGLRRPRLEGPVAGFGSATTGHAIGEDLPGGTIAGFDGIPGSILFVNEDELISQDNDNLFYSQTFRAMIVGNAGLMWGPHNSPDVVLIRDAADTLALKRGTNNQTFRIYETTSASTPAITQNLLLADGDDIDRQVYTTASISPAANKLIICMVMAADQGFNDVIHVDSVTGAGLTWVEMVDLNFDTIVSERRCLAIYRALGSPTGGALTITLDKVGTAARWIIVEFDNVDTSGTNGSGAIVQNATNRADAGTSITATLAAFASSSNATIGCFGSGSVSTVLTEGAGFAKIGEVDLGTIKAMMTFRNDNDTTVDMSQTVDGDMAVVAFEIRGSGQNERYIELIGLGASGGAEVMSVTGSGITDRELIVGTRDDADLKLFRNNIEQVRITDTSTDLGLNKLAFGSAFGVEDVILERVSARVLQMNSDPLADSDNELRIVARDDVGAERYLQLFAQGSNQARVAAIRAGGGARFDLELFTSVGSVEIWTDGVQRWIFGAGTGGFNFELLPSVTNTYDIGNVALAVRDVFTNRVFIGQNQTAAYDAITIDGTDLAGDGQQDSGAIIMTGLGFESATPHDADWKIFVDVTSDAAASTWKLQTRIDAAGFADVLDITDGGLMSIFGGLDVTGVFSVFNNITNQAQTQIRTAEATVVTSSGSSVTASNLIPAGSFVVGITTRVTTLVTGPAGYDVGDGTDVDRWGNSILVAEDTTSDITDFQTSALTLFPAANDVVITSDGVDFTAGAILITVHYMTLVAPIA